MRRITLMGIVVTALASGTGCSGSLDQPGGSTSGASDAGSKASTGGTTPIPTSLEPGTCGLDHPAFCEKFDTPHPGGRGGELDERIWSFARWAHAVQYLWVRQPASTFPDRLFPATFCGEPFSGILPPDDVKLCEGTGVDGTSSRQLNEVFDDEGDFALHSMRVRQPFDFTGRTGTVVWDVDGKVNPINLGHGWWFEMWITEDPAPIPYHVAPTVDSRAKKSVGLAFQFGADCPEDLTGGATSWQSDVGWQSALETVHVTDDYTFIHDYPFWEIDQAPERCFHVADAHLNHFELRISKDSAELWASDYDDPKSLKRRATANNLNLTFEKGYVHFQHGQYNATKDGLDACGSGGGDLTQCPTRSQTFRWDNIGFDGPVYPTPRAYDVPDNTLAKADGVQLGWYLDDGKAQAFTLPGVDIDHALSASFNFDCFMAVDQALEYRFNQGPWHSFTVPAPTGMSGQGGGGGLHGFSVPAPVSELVQGDNVIEVRVPSPTGAEGIGNMDLTVEAQ